MHYTRFLGELAFAMSRAGEVAGALKAIDRAIAICERQEERWAFAELLRLKGEILLMEGSSKAVAAAEDQFLCSLNWARRQGALSWELRTATSLASPMCSGTGREDARELLAAVYDRFTEGFETGDLKAARGLLANLS